MGICPLYENTLLGTEQNCFVGALDEILLRHGVKIKYTMITASSKSHDLQYRGE